MRCPVCDRPAQAGQRFCTGCGAALADPGGGQPTSVVTVQPPPDSEWADPVWAPTGSVPAVTTAQLPATEPVPVEPAEPMTPATADVPRLPEPDLLTPYDYGDDDPTLVAPVGATTAVLTEYVEPLPTRRVAFRVNAVLVLGLATAAVGMAALFADVLRIESDRALSPATEAPAGFGLGVWLLDDLADNLSLAGMLAVLAIAAGALASAFGWRWGSGLAAGGGLAYGGVAAVAVGLAQLPIDAAHEFARVPADPPFTLSITRDLGYSLLIVAAALGVVLFFAAFSDASDHRAGLNPWIAALGGLAVVITTAGPLLPEGRAVFSDNWYLIEGPGEAPAMLVAGRGIQLIAFTVTGLVGFLTVRRFGVGMAIGGSLPVIWMTVSTLLELGDRPVGPGFRNPGSRVTDVHGVTVIGVAALASMLVLAIIAAYDQNVRERTY